MANTYKFPDWDRMGKSILDNMFYDLSLDPNIFREFALENKDLVYGVKSYPLINSDEFNKWIDLQGNDSAKQIAIFVKSVIKHISFDEFMGRLYNLSVSINSYIHKFDKIFFVITADLKKSNTWISIILFNMLGEGTKRITYVITEIMFHNMIHYFVEYATYYKTLIIVPDDVAYSGNEISNIFVRDMFGSILDITYNLKRFNIPKDRFSFFIACPFIGSSAISLWENSKTEFYIPESAYIFKNINQEATDAHIDLNKLLQDNFNFQVFSSTDSLKEFLLVSPIYFDHKLASGLSILNKVLRLGVYAKRNTLPNKSDIIGVFGSLIKGCKIDINSPVINDFINENRLISFGNLDCPPPFYKTIKYRFRGKEIDTFVQSPEYKQTDLYKRAVNYNYIVSILKLMSTQ